MSSRVRAALLAVLLLLLLVGPAAGRAVPLPAQQADVGAATPPQSNAVVGPAAPSPDRTAAQTRPRPETTFRVALRPNGDARWTVTTNFSISSPSDREAFESLAADFADGDLDTHGLTAFRAASERASNATGRSMSITDERRTSEMHGDTGQLILRFTWTNFGRQSGRLLYVDDVFNASGETWFPAIDRNQHLVVDPPPGYTIDEATPAGYAVSGGSLRWDGPREFEAGTLSISYRRVDGPVTTTPPNGTGPGGSFPVGIAGLVLAGLGLVAVVAYVVSVRDVDVPVPSSGEPGATGDVGESGEGTPVTNGPSEASAAAGGAADEDDVDEELLSDEERIERLLERNGGRMKQATIVKETGWSNAKVSQLLSAMDDEGRIDKLRIGRENLISFPDEDVTDLDEE